MLSELRKISPMLDGFSLGQSISDHHGVECYPAMRDDSDKRHYIVKKISLPASQDRVEALLLTGAYRDADAVTAYYEELAEGVRTEVQTLNSLAEQRGFVPFLSCQVLPMEYGIGFEVYLLTRYRRTLERFTRRSPMTHLGAVNLGIDLCAAMAVCRETGWMYVDLKPENIYIFGDQEYRIGDLGFVSMDSLEYASLPDRYRSLYTAPEVADAYARMNATMDTYALGLVLYQLYNSGKLPFDGAEGRRVWLDRLAAGESIEPPCCADEEMAGIILKACALDPAERWQTPAEMGHALISYMQRNEVNDDPIVPPAPPEPEPEEPAAQEEIIEEPAQAEEAAGEETAAEAEEAVQEEAPAEIEEIPAEEASDEPEELTEAETPDEAEEAAEAEACDEPEEITQEEAPAEIEEISAEDTPAKDEEIAAAETPEEAGETAEAEAPEEAGETAEAETPDEETADGDWVDLIDAILSDDPAETDRAEEENVPTLRQILEAEELSGDELDISPEEVSAETAEFLSIAQELIDHEAPAPLVAPEPIDIPIPEPLPIELPEEEVPADPLPQEPSGEEADDTQSDVPPAPPAEKKASSGLWKKLLGTAAALAAAAGLLYGAWYFYQNHYLQTIDSMSCDGTGTQVTICVDTAMDQSKLTVICKDTYGNALQGTLENGIVTFSDLVPGSQYIISLEPQGFHKLLGTTSVTYSTPAETKLLHLSAVTGQEPGSAIISFGIEGRDVESWTLSYTAEGLEPQSISFTGHSVTVTELSVGTEYTFTLTAPEDVLLVGENVITHTASELIQADHLVLSGFSDGVMTVSWTAPEGADRWIVRCSDSAGYDQLQEITGTTASFEGITEGTRYTVEVIAASMTLGIRAEITAESSAISGFTATLSGSMVELSWNSAASDTPWTIECSVDGQVLQVLTPEENRASFGPVAPGTAYSFAIKAANVSADMPAATAAVEAPAAGTFSANKLDADSIIVEMYDVPSKSNWGYSTLQRAREQDSFKPGGALALLYTVTKPYNFDDSEFETVFVIRTAEGSLVSTSARTRVWDDMWDNGYCTETVSGLPAVQGSYILSIYVANGLLAELPFSIK